MSEVFFSEYLLIRRYRKLLQYIWPIFKRA